jgi:hypothetical protein
MNVCQREELDRILDSLWVLFHALTHGDKALCNFQKTLGSMMHDQIIQKLENLSKEVEKAA